MATFFSYSAAYGEFVHLVRVFAQRSLGEIFAFQRSPGENPDVFAKMAEHLAASDRLVVFAGARCGPYQAWEVEQYNTFLHQKGKARQGKARHALVVVMEPRKQAERLFKEGIPLAAPWERIYAAQKSLKDEEAAERVARAIADQWGLRWEPFDGLPQDPHLFSYEKTIIKFFHNVRRLFAGGNIDTPVDQITPTLSEADTKVALDIQAKWRRGCPMVWPDVRDLAADAPETTPNTLPEEEIGPFRRRDARVLVKALTKSAAANSGVKEFSLPEAGPREDLYFPPPGH